MFNMNIAIVSGSARPKRQSHQVALEVQQRLNALGVTNWIWDVKETNLPLLDYTFETHPEPSEMLRELKLKLDQTTGLIIISPEHNGSYSGALKNAMDYFFKEYQNKVFGFITVSTGVLGGINALKSLQHYGLKLNGVVCPQFLITPNVQKLFTDQVLTDEAYRQRLQQFLDNYIAFSNLISKK
jgi:NAD(P)H-dependent FMN reductase